MKKSAPKSNSPKSSRQFAFTSQKKRTRSSIDGKSATKARVLPRRNRAYNSIFRWNRLSIGLVLPIAAYPDSPVPSLDRDLERIQIAEELGFSAVWLRDVPFNVPSFGDAGQVYDPFVYLGLLAGQTKEIALGVASLILPLRHPAHVAKAAASVDKLSGGRLILGVASGDRPQEYPAMALPYDCRGKAFRDSFQYIEAMAESWPHLDNSFGQLSGQLDLLPKPTGNRIPLLITGRSQQKQEWLANHGDGWITYPRSILAQNQAISQWRAQSVQCGEMQKPVLEPLYIDLVEQCPHPIPIHLGYRMTLKQLKSYLKTREQIGVNHVAINLRFNQAPLEATLTKLAQNILPDFSMDGVSS